MTGFAARWLDLREPADILARDTGLLGKALAAADLRPGDAIVDLGCGTGATLRAFAGGGRPQVWRLIDNDAALLELAARRAGPDASVETLEADLKVLDPAWFKGATLATASALFDLASQDFVDRLADRLAASGVGLYAALNYDGRMSWGLPDERDDAVVAAFNRDQRRDKGLGPALGPDAATSLAEAFAARGFAVTQAGSSWHLGPAEGDLQRAHLEGVADAALATGDVAPADIEDWLAVRFAAIDTGATSTVGHTDILALAVKT